MRDRNFNSQPHKEADVFNPLSIRYWTISTHSLTRRLTLYIRNHHTNQNISTHSLTRRLTILFCLFYGLHNHFNSQPHKEADMACIDESKKENIFQLTASQGGWLYQQIIVASPRYFNSQPHKEADFMSYTVDGFSFHFNSQPHKEADD